MFMDRVTRLNYTWNLSVWKEVSIYETKLKQNYRAWNDTLMLEDNVTRLKTKYLWNLAEFEQK